MLEPHTNVMPEAEPFFWGGGDTGLLLVHGFTGSTQSMREYGRSLHEQHGFTVYGPRLAGHGISPEAMAETGAHDWLASAEEGLSFLQGKCKRVVVAGLSMGGTISANLAARFPEKISACITINAPAEFPAELAAVLAAPDRPEYLQGIGSDIAREGVTEVAYDRFACSCADELSQLVKDTFDLLPKVGVPTLVLQSRQDHVVPPHNAELLMAKLGTPEKELVWLDRSYHVATLDHDLPRIVALTVEACKRVGSN